MLPDLLSGHGGRSLTARRRRDRGRPPAGGAGQRQPVRIGDLAGMGRRARLDTGVLGVVDRDRRQRRPGGRAAARRQQPRADRAARPPRSWSPPTPPEIPVGVDGEALLLPTPVRCTDPAPGAAGAGAARPARGAPAPDVELGLSCCALRPSPGTGAAPVTPGHGGGCDRVGRELDRPGPGGVRRRARDAHAEPWTTRVARISRAADHSMIWLGIAAALAVVGARPRRAAVVGLGGRGGHLGRGQRRGQAASSGGRPARAGGPVRTHVVRMPASAVLPVRARRLGLRVLDRGGRPACPSWTPCCGSRRPRSPTPGCTPACTTRRRDRGRGDRAGMGTAAHHVARRIPATRGRWTP